MRLKQETPLQGLPEPPDFARGMLPPDTFAGRVAMVSGGGSGFGLAMAMGFAQAGAAIGVMGRTAERCAEGVASIEKIGGKAFGVQADVRDAGQVADAFDRVEENLGPVTLLASNAGGNFAVLSERMSRNAWKAVTQIAIDGTFNCATEMARRCISNGLPGAVVNNAATYAWTGFPGDAHSASAKAAVVEMTEVMAREWAPHRIRVNTIAAGFFPHGNSISAKDPAVGVARLNRMIPAGRVGRMQEVGWACAFLCSPFAEAINGHTMVTDGGDMLRPALWRPDFVSPRQRESLW
jgi:NAD(P)-dependent dehydrogenase (short-subunit alcohol dehydrogenase family)